MHTIINIYKFSIKSRLHLPRGYISQILHTFTMNVKRNNILLLQQ